MKNEISVLLNLDKTRMSSQREIAKAAGISLGNANLAINNLIDKGFLKKEKAKDNDIFYDLTQEGEKERDIIVLSKANSVISAFYNIEKAVDRFIEKEAIGTSNIITLYGEDDWFRRLISQKLDSKYIKWELVLELDKDKKGLVKNSVFIVWNPCYKEVIKSLNVKYFYILEYEEQIKRD